MKKLHSFALLGSPIAHSLSPKIFELMGEYLEIDITYDLIEMSTEEELNSFLCDGFSKYQGVNLTTPLKNKTPLGQTLNVLKSTTPISGVNTDRLAIESLLRPFQEIVSSVTLVGAGGAAMAAISALKKINFIKDISLINRSPLADDFKTKVHNHFPNSQITSVLLSEVIPFSTDLFINATPLGFGGEENFLPEKINHAKIIFEMIYVPKMTQLALRGVKIGAHVITGDLMLIEQAISAYEFWSDSPLHNRAELKAFIAERLYE